MKSLIKTILFLFISIAYGKAQEPVTLVSSKMIKREQISLAQLEGWIFREGHDSSWANTNLDLSGWKKLKPTELSAKYSDKSGKVEGWFKLKFKLDDDLTGVALGLKRGGWAATDIYIDGKFFASFGNTAEDGKVYEEYNPIDKFSQPLHLEIHKEHSIALHFVDYVSRFPPRKLKSGTSGGTRVETGGLAYLLMLTSPRYNLTVQNDIRETLKYRTIWLSVTALLAVLFWLLAIQNLQERVILLLIATCISLSALSNFARFYFTDPEASFMTFRIAVLSYNLSRWLSYTMSFLIITRILNFKFSKKLNPFVIVVSFLGSFLIFFNFFDLVLNGVIIIGLFIFLYVLLSSWKKLRGAQWAIVAGLLLSVLFAFLFALVIFLNPQAGRSYLLTTCIYFSLPLSLVVYISLRLREIIREVRQNAGEVVRLLEEKKDQALHQQKILQEEVKRQTAELRNTLEDLRSTQSQLIQSEKMASLGELTAGIAHEIQNPLNFVNNFSDVNTELVDEAAQEIEKGNISEVKTILHDIKENELKINHHGKRADAIVKGMLQHSRASSGQKESADINALTDEYLRLAYHGMRAKDKSFNATTKTDFDNSIGKINVVPQDIGRVVLNLINNAFYAVNERVKENISGYEPIVIVKTSTNPPLGGRGAGIEISVKDNGNGIPQKVLEKIFQPFFTTKPTGQGTGLGLSLSYDIIKAHGGKIKVETKEGIGSEFIICLP